MQAMKPINAAILLNKRGTLCAGWPCLFSLEMVGTDHSDLEIRSAC